MRWSRYVAAYPPTSGWTLKYRFTCAAGKFDVTAAADDAGYAASITSADSAEFVADSYTWVEFVTNDADERHTLAQGTCVVLPDLAAQAEGSDQRSDAQRSLDAVNAFLLKGVSSGVAEYEIHGRMIKYRTTDELLKLRSLFQSEVNREKAARGEPTPRRRVLTGFGRSC